MKKLNTVIHMLAVFAVVSSISPVSRADESDSGTKKSKVIDGGSIGVVLGANGVNQGTEVNELNLAFDEASAFVVHIPFTSATIYSAYEGRLELGTDGIGIYHHGNIGYQLLPFKTYKLRPLAGAELGMDLNANTADNRKVEWPGQIGHFQII